MSISAESGTGVKSKVIGGLFVGLAIGGVGKIAWAYLKDGSLLEAAAITLVSLALAALSGWLRSG